MNSSTGRRLKISIGLGGASLLMILTILALTAFAVLSLATANAQWSLAKKNAMYVQSYYAADARAERLRADVADYLHLGKGLADNPKAYQDFWAANLKDAAYDSLSGELHCKVPLNDNQVIKIVLVLDPRNATQRTESWRVENIDEGDYTSPLNVWPGE